MTIALHGLGTGVGRVRPRICAQRVRAAIIDVRAVLAGTHRLPESWLYAQAMRNALYNEPRKSTKKDRIW